MKDHPSYKIKSVKHDSFDRIHIVFKDGRDSLITMSTKRWEDEELDELHNHLYSLLSFINPDVIAKMAGYNKLIEEHISAVLKTTTKLLDEHGGRFYKP